MSRYTPLVRLGAISIVVISAVLTAGPVLAQEETVYRSVVPVVGHTLGLGDVEWRSELAMTNPHQTELTVGMTLMGGGEPFFLTTLVPGQTMALGELVGSVFGSPGLISILEVAAMGPGPVSVGVQVLGYRNGELITRQPVPVYEPVMPFVSQRLSGLEVSEQFRTNLGIANSGDEDASVTLALQRLDGRTIASVSVPIAARSLVHDPLQSYFPLITEASNLTVVAESNRSSVIVYASVISNSSHEARFVAPAPNY